jgi:hypothetical protein
VEDSREEPVILQLASETIRYTTENDDKEFLRYDLCQITSSSQEFGVGADVTSLR